MKKNERYVKELFTLDPTEVIIERRIINIGELIGMLHKGKISFSSEIQRKRDLWKADKQSRLIESVFLNLPLPSFYLEYNGVTGNYEIIDGLQRICAIDNYANKKTLKLKNLDFLYQMEKKGWDDISFYEKMTFNNSEIVLYIVSNKASFNVRFVLFSRLNSEGTPLSSQEIRNALFPSVTRNILRPLSEIGRFKSLNIPSSRGSDLEFVLRFIAFYECEYLVYSGRMDFFLNSTLNMLKEFNPNKIFHLSKVFSESLEWSIKLLGENVFRRPGKNGNKGRISRVLFESLMVTIARYLNLMQEINPDIFKENYKQLFTDDTFLRSISSGTGDAKNVKIRFKKTEEVLLMSRNRYK